MITVEMKDIPGYEGRYAATKDGRIYSYITEKFLKQNQVNSYKKYLIVFLYDSQGNKKKYYVHRLIAMTYLPNPENLPEVNHRNEIQTDNNIENLEWCSHIDNIRYGTGSARSAAKRCKPIRCIETGEVYSSIAAAAEAFNMSHQGMSACVCGRTKTCAGHHFEYALT